MRPHLPITRLHSARLALLLLALGVLSACAPTDPSLALTRIDELHAAAIPAAESLRVVATTTLVGDLLRQVGGYEIKLTVLLEPGSDPHSFQATPANLRAVSEAQLIFVSGFGLEGGMLKSLQAAAPDVPMVELSEGLQSLHSLPEDGEDPEDHGHGADPHVWFDPASVVRWAENTSLALGRADPEHRASFAANAQAYVRELEALQTWIEVQVARVPPERRILVTDHRVLETFAARFGFEIAGTLVDSFSSDAEPSARELAALETRLHELRIAAVFVGMTVNPKLAERVGADLGIPVVRLYTGSLSEPDGPAPDYVSMMEYNVRAIVEALR